MPRVRMYYPPGDRVQYASAAAFEAEYQHEGWVLVDDEPAPAEPVLDPEPEVVDEALAGEPVADPATPKRARRS